MATRENFDFPEENWRPQAPDARGRHATFNSALQAAFKDLLTERNAFFDSLPDRWGSLFPGLPARPGRYENGTIWLYVRHAPLSFALRPKLPAIKRKLAALDGAPKKFDLRLEIRA